MAIAITPESGGPPTIFDAVVQSQRTKDVDITEHPVESGTNIADHVRPKAEEIRVEGVIADFHLPGTPAGLLYGPGGDTSAEDTYAVLEGYRDSGTLLRVDTKGKSFDNMVIQSMQRTDTKDGYDTIKVHLSLKEIRIVSTQIVAVTKPSITAAKPKVDTGKQAGTPATDAEKRQSTLAKLVDKLGLDKSITDALTPTFGSH